MTGYERMKQAELEYAATLSTRLDNYHNDVRQIHKMAIMDAISEIDEWRKLLIKAHETAPYANPIEAKREHENTMRLLDVIESKLTKKMEPWK